MVETTEQTIRVIPAEKTIESKESVELELTAKGQYKWAIKLKDEILTKDTIKRLISLEQQLKDAYPNNVTII